MGRTSKRLPAVAVQPHRTEREDECRERAQDGGQSKLFMKRVGCCFLNVNNRRLNALRRLRCWKRHDVGIEVGRQRLRMMLP
eukprot:1348332-Rhodomonas_salina.1